jgi:hypothetical protein
MASPSRALRHMLASYAGRRVVTGLVMVGIAVSL